MYNNQSTFPNRFNVVNGLIMEHMRPNDNKPVWHYEHGDDCWWSALAHIAYDNKETQAALVKHFDTDLKKLFRSDDAVEASKDNCSRDQLIMFLSAIALTCSEVELKYYAKALLKVRISKRYIMTPSLWYWVKFLATGDAKYARKFYWWFNLENKPAMWWTLKLVKWYGLTPYYGNEDYIPEKVTGFDNLLLSTKYPSFAFHLACWMLYVMEKKGHENGKLNTDMLYYLLTVDSSNYLCIALLDKYSRDVMELYQEDYLPRNDFRWQRFPMYRNGKPFGGMCDKYLIKLFPYEAQYNTIDKDILTKIK